MLFDITQHEPVLDVPAARLIFHPYPDSLPDEAAVQTYSLSELLAEKTRALFERTRPRDLYDVIYLLDNQREVFDFHSVRSLFKKKCQTKGTEPPSTAELLQIVQADEELRSEWSNMLAYQLPVLPSLDDLISRLPAVIAWIEEAVVVAPEPVLAAIPVGMGEVSVAPAGIQYWGSGLPLEAIRFAGANRLLVEFSYHGRYRRAEAYSLRRASTGNLLFYAWEQGATHIKAFKVAEMHNVRATTATFRPRYRIELTSHGSLQAPP